MAADLIDLNRPCTQARFASLLGITQQAVAAHIAAGTLRRRAPLREWLAAMHNSQAAIRGGHGGELASQRARLAKEQADKVARENAVREGQLIPAEELVRALSDVAGQAIPILEALPGRIRMANPDTSVAVLKTIELEIVKLRNLWADIQLGGGDR